jgi:IrrE N-terminal-like domain
MSTNYRVKTRSDSEVRSLAKRLLQFFNADRRYPVNVLRHLRHGKIWTVFGLKKLVFRVLPDSELGEDDARTIFSPGLVTIEAKESVVRGAEWGVGRDRQTLAHEFGHAVMHEGPPMARGTGAVGNTTPGYIKPFESAEHQAKVFAAAYLIIDEFAEGLETAEEISTHFGISLQSASIYFDQREEDRHRGESAERVKRLAEEFRNSVSSPPTAPDYLDLNCPSCGEQKLKRIGIKYLCDACEFVGDLPDGDTEA